jgi:spore coat protein U-like protein
MTRIAKRWLQTIVASSLASMGLSAHAAITCTAMANLPTASYTPNAALAQTGSVTVTCNSTTGPVAVLTAIPVSLTNNSGLLGNTTAVFGSFQLAYGLWRQPSFTTAWSGASNTAINVTIPAGSSSGNTTANFQAKIPAGNWAPPGAYTDNVIVTASYTPPASAAQTTQTTFAVTFNVQSFCQFTTAPVDIDFGTYNALTTGLVTKNSPFALQCSNTIAPTLALSPPSGSVAGLNYSLSLQTPNPIGTGLIQGNQINATMNGAQAGKCSAGACADSKAHTLTVTY